MDRKEINDRIIDRAARSFYEASCRVDHVAPNDWADVRAEIKDNAAQALVDNGCGDLYKRDDDDLDTARSWLREAEDAALGKEGTQPCPGSCALWYTNAGEEGVHRCAPFESKDLTPDGFVPQHVRARPPE